MKAGTLNTRVSLQRKGGKDDLGGPTNAWTEYAKAWANLALLSGKETASGSSSVSTGNGSIRIRYRTDVTAADRVIAGTLVFNVVAVLPDINGRDHTDLVVTVGANNGG
ncbi:phage head closure protein [Robbsia andropogonis]|uniref:phage head closure protein n=1 Tax=Robbsia andropogonis TaxID=28092 RepID=UPI002A6B36FE|nr:phage head closure protein [Robbsia andropogonis]